jgi:hypothetical protein
LLFPETKTWRPVSVQVDMNTKSKRTRLIVEFKELQRLPDWPIIKLTNTDRPSENSGQQQRILPPARSEAVCAAQAFAE